MPLVEMHRDERIERTDGRDFENLRRRQPRRKCHFTEDDRHGEPLGIRSSLQSLWTGR